MLFDKPHLERSVTNGCTNCKTKVIPKSNEFVLRGSIDWFSAMTVEAFTVEAWFDRLV